MNSDDEYYLIEETDEEEPSGGNGKSLVGLIILLITIFALIPSCIATLATAGPGTSAREERAAKNTATPTATPGVSLTPTPTPEVTIDPDKEKSHDFDLENCIYIKKHGFAIPIPWKWKPLNGRALEYPDYTVYLGTDEIRVNDPKDAIFKMWSGTRICDNLHDIEEGIYDTMFFYGKEDVECSDFEYITICDREALSFRFRYTHEGKQVNGKIAVLENPALEHSAYFFRLTQANDSKLDHTEDFDAIIANIRDGDEFLPTDEEAYLESVYHSVIEEMNAEETPVPQTPSVTKRPNMQGYVNPEDPRHYSNPYEYADVIADTYGGDLDDYDDVWNEAYMEWERASN